jgi:hypothetical protein
MSFPVEKEVLSVTASVEGVGWVYYHVGPGPVVWSIYDQAGFAVFPGQAIVRPGVIEFHSLPPGELLTVVIIG